MSGMKTTGFIRDIALKYPAHLAANSVLTIVQNLVEVGSMAFLGPVVDMVMYPGGTEHSLLTRRVTSLMAAAGVPVTLGWCLTVFLGLVTLASAFRVLAQYTILKTRYAVLRDLTMGTFDDFFNARWYFFGTQRQGTIFNTFIRELGKVGAAFASVAVCLTGSLRLIVFLTVPLLISWEVTLVSLLVAMILAWPLMWLGRVGYRLGRQNTATANRYGSVLQESFGLARVILGFGNQKWSRERLKKTFDSNARSMVRSQTLNITVPALYQPFTRVVVVAALFTGSLRNVAVAELAVLMAALLKAVATIGTLVTARTVLLNLLPGFEHVRALREEARKLGQPSGNKKYGGFEKEISLTGVTFSYPPGSPVLKDISISIKKGQMVAVVGESGAGKSTLVDLMMGFSQPDTGHVAIDGIDLTEFDILSYRHRIGYVPQESALFNMSVRDNLLWACPEASDEHIKAACQHADAHDFIEKLPHGYEAEVGDYGTRLSGGQRQRVALARAIIRKPDILFLDEATSALDTQSERLIQHALETISRMTTIMVIAHRLSTIMNADYIYVLKEGAIIEEGSYQDLVDRNGHFNRMVKMQLLETE